MTIRSRLTRAFSSVALVIAAGAGITIWQFSGVVRETQQILAIDNRLTAVEELERTIGRLSRRLSALSEQRESGKLIGATHDARSELAGELEHALASFSDSRATPPGTLRASLQGVYDELDAIERLAEVRDWLAIRLRIDVQLNQILADIGSAVDRVAAGVGEDRARALAQVEFRRESAESILAITAVLSLLTALLLGYRVIRSIIQPMTALKQAAHQLAAKDFRLRLEITTEDELAEVGRDVLVAAKELEASYSALQRSNRDLEQFAHAVSHDLREPLRSVSVLSGLLKKNYGDRIGEEGSEFLKLILGATRRMHDLIDGILMYSRLSYSQSGEREEVEISEVIETVASNLQAMIAESGASVTAKGLPRVRANRVQMIQVFQNLVSNGIKYRRDGTMPRIEISARQSSKGPLFCVSDNGIGIAPENYSRIFEAFERVDEGHEGIGLGLATTKRIIEQHGGEIWVESDGVHGSCFLFSIP